MSRAIEDQDVETAIAIIEEIGVSGLLIAASQACEEIGKEYQNQGKRELADTWFDNGGACQVASEQVNDAEL